MSEKLSEWTTKINDSEFHIFKSTVAEISKITIKDGASASELAGAILKDASLTAKILKFSNSPYYNPAQAKSHTISRAVVVLGFDVVRDLSLSVAVVESLLSAKSRAIVANLIAQSFHAATQARVIAEKAGETKLEEVFIATLLHNIGEVAFWCAAEPEIADQLVTAMEDPETTPEMAQKKVLGFKFTDLTKNIVEKWCLSEDLDDAIKGNVKNNPRASYIIYGQEVAEAVGQGWDSKDAKKIYRKIAAKLNMTTAATKKSVRGAATMAAEVAKSYGASSVVNLIPGQETHEDTEKNGEAQITAPEPDPFLQLKILRDLSSLIKARPDLNLILELVLEGMHRGVGLDRVCFALYMPLKSQVRAKFAVGAKADVLLNTFAIGVGGVTSNPFSEVLFERDSGLWMSKKLSSNYSKSVMDKISGILNTTNFMIAPVTVNQRPIGIFYADRHFSKRELDQATYDSFEYFAHQASITIELVNNRLAIKNPVSEKPADP